MSMEKDEYEIMTKIYRCPKCNGIYDLPKNKLICCETCGRVYDTRVSVCNEKDNKLNEFSVESTTTKSTAIKSTIIEIMIVMFSEELRNCQIILL
jgi:hypothetical protein